MGRSRLNFHFLILLFLCVVLISASHAQTCNTNIPLNTPDSEFTDHGDGTVTHHRTGLMWKKCKESLSGAAPDQGIVSVMTWSETLTHAMSHELGNYTDWRLPNIKELATIAELACHEPVINLSVFPWRLYRSIGSSPPNASIATEAWALNIGNGNDNTQNKGALADVWLVRGGQ